MQLGNNTLLHKKLSVMNSDKYDDIYRLRNRRKKNLKFTY